MLKIQIVEDNVIMLAGRFDASQVETAKQELARIQTSCVIDMSELEYISSAGLGTLLALRQRLDQTGKTVTLRNLNKLVRDVFRYSRLDSVFPIE